MSNSAVKSPQPRVIPNTLDLPCEAANTLVLQSQADVPALVQWVPHFNGMRIVGGGSNVVLPDRLAHLVVLVRNTGIEDRGVTDGKRYIDVAAGEVWHDWVTHALQAGWHGLENLALIPGTVGAAPVQNIGAYGVEVERFIDSVLVCDPKTGELERISQQACDFAYRDSAFKSGRYRDKLILSVRFALPLQWTSVLEYPELRDHVLRDVADVTSVTPRSVYDSVVAIRQAKLPDPLDTPNAGSFFKNPIVPAADFEALKARDPNIVAYPQPDGRVKLAAAWLIDQCGWKGRQHGSVRMHPRQALVLTNTGGAKSKDVLLTAREIMRDVQARFGVRLEMEPVCWA